VDPPRGHSRGINSGGTLKTAFSRDKLKFLIPRSAHNICRFFGCLDPQSPTAWQRCTQHEHEAACCRAELSETASAKYAKERRFAVEVLSDRPVEAISLLSDRLALNIR
jgi:hypothetical protein